MYRIPFILLIIASLLIQFGCEPNGSGSNEKNSWTPADPPVKVPAFDSKNAFEMVKKQVEFGPRVPNSPGHAACKKWLVEKLEGYAVNVIQQDFSAEAYNGTILNGTNIIAQFNPKATSRICLAAHWDTRHIADSDLCNRECDKPIDGADDGGSGVGVLLEIARNLKESPINYGVDIVLFDAEDYGDENKDDDAEKKTQAQIEASMRTWALGSQYWSKNLHAPAYRPTHAILLDMVGAKNARFAKENISMQINPPLVNKVWNLAQSMGYDNYFKNEVGGSVTDDHYFVWQNARIAMIDIINMSDKKDQSFGDHWHTQDDNIDIIDPNTLQAVGQVMLAVLYRAENGTF